MLGFLNVYNDRSTYFGPVEGHQHGDHGFRDLGIGRPRSRERRKLLLVRGLSMGAKLKGRKILLKLSMRYFKRNGWIKGTAWCWYTCIGQVSNLHLVSRLVYYQVGKRGTRVITVVSWTRKAFITVPPGGKNRKQKGERK